MELTSGTLTAREPALPFSGGTLCERTVKNRPGRGIAVISFDQRGPMEVAREGKCSRSGITLNRVAYLHRG